MTSIVVRGVLTAIVLTIWGWLEGFINIAAPLVSGPAATWQLQNSDSAYLMSQYGMRFSGIMNGLFDIVALLALVAIWWGFFRKKSVVTTLVAGLAVFGFTAPSYAYYDTTDYAEWQNILPNESGFLIPMVGANKDSQAKFQSIDYLRDNKVPAKRVQIPHVTLNGSGWVKNSVVPAAQLILVDRAPYQREWTADPHKGTSSKNEAFRCESRDSYGITTAVTIAAFVTEDDASAFLYHFGVNAPAGKRDDPQVVFASYVFGRSLEQVMDSNVRGKVHSVLCAEMAKFDLNSEDAKDRLFNHKTDIITAVEKQVKELYKPMGISIEYIGFADELTYDQSIQTAINRVFIASKEKEAALALQTALPVLQAEADMEIKRGLAKGLADKGLPALPSFLLDPKTITDMVHGFFSGDLATAAPPMAPAKK